MPKFNVFLSHNSIDKPAVRAIAEALVERGLSVWLDEWELQPGVPWQPKLEKAIEDSAATAVFVGPNGIGPWADAEMQMALDMQIRKMARVIPVALPGMPPDVAIPGFLRLNTWVSFKEPNDSKALDQLEWGITGEKPRPRIPRRSADSRTDGVDMSPVDAAVAALTSQLRNRNITYFVGSAAYADNTQQPPDADELGRRMLGDLQVLDLGKDGIAPPADLVGTCYAASRGGDGLEDRVRDLVINRSYQIPTTHRLLAKLVKLIKDRPPSRSRRTSPHLIVTTNFDLLIELSLLFAGVPFSRVVQLRSKTEVLVNTYAGFKLLSDREIEVVDRGQVRTLSLDDLQEFESWIAGSNARVLPSADVSFSQLVDPVVYKHHGSHDIEKSCVISTDHYLDLMRSASKPGFVPTDVEKIIENSPALLVGYNPLDPDFRLLYHALLNDRMTIDRTFRYAPLPTSLRTASTSYRHLERALWKEFKSASQQLMRIEILDESPEDFLEKLLRSLSDSAGSGGAGPA